jgi:Ala-tRNA(Pro) deacylase
MSDIYKFLEDHNIEYERHDHAPVYTVDDVNRLVPPLDAAKTKSLFLCDAKGARHFLVIVSGEKRVDLKALPDLLKSSRLRFGSPDRLKKYLGVDPGSVSLFAAINDIDMAVEIIMDSALWESDAFQFHPLVNTTTLVISKDNIQRFVDQTGHNAQILDVPGL